MDLSQEFPLMFCLNLAKRQDRRFQSKEAFEAHGLEVERFPAIDANWVRRRHGFETAGRYAHTLGVRMMIRRALLQRAPAVFIFEDDVSLHPDLQERLADLTLPDDWGLFYLGASHLERPEVVAPGLVQVKGALSTHAFGVRASHYRQVLDALKHEGEGKGIRPPADAILARIHPKIPTYAPYPDLASQRESHSDLEHGVYHAYTDDCQQDVFPEVLDGVMAESLGGQAYLPAKRVAESRQGWFRTSPLPILTWRENWAQTTREIKWPAPAPFTAQQKIAFLFLTRSDHHHPAIWEAYWEGYRHRVSIYGHAADRSQLSRNWLQEAQITADCSTKWGTISLVRAQLALLREAVKDRDNAFFMYASESCVPIRSFGDLLKKLQIDPRSHFEWELEKDLRERDPEKADRTKLVRRVPAGLWIFHPQWILLNREAAELLVEDDFTDVFETAHAPDENYFGTVLKMKGYPLDSLVCPHAMTWAHFKRGASHPKSFNGISIGEVSELMASGCYFARKFQSESSIGGYDLHRGTLESTITGSHHGRATH